MPIQSTNCIHPPEHPHSYPFPRGMRCERRERCELKVSQPLKRLVLPLNGSDPASPHALFAVGNCGTAVYPNDHARALGEGTLCDSP